MTASMNLGEGVPRFLSWLEWARANMHASAPTVPLRAEERNPEGVITDVEAAEFLYFQVKIEVASSNVAWMQYFPEEEKLLVGFKNTYVYEYFGITAVLAYDFYIAVSKGKWVWDNLRTVRRAYQFLYS